MVLSSLYDPHVLVCMPDNNEMTDGVLEYFLLDLDQGITELLDRLRCNLAASDGPRYNVPEVFYWI